MISNFIVESLHIRFQFHEKISSCLAPTTFTALSFFTVLLYYHKWDIHCNLLSLHILTHPNIYQHAFKKIKMQWNITCTHHVCTYLHTHTHLLLSFYYVIVNLLLARLVSEVHHVGFHLPPLAYLLTEELASIVSASSLPL